MAAVSQGLIEFANEFRAPAAPGVEVIETARYRITLTPNFPIPGPNNVSWIRCTPDEADSLISEIRATVAPHHLPVMWILDPQTEPFDFPDYLAARGVHPERHAPEVKVMVLRSDAELGSPEVRGLEIRDALTDAEAFRSSDVVNAEAFGDSPRDVTPEQRDAQERRRTDQIAAGNRRVLLATIDGEPAGSAGLTLFSPFGAHITGGAVLEKFRGRGVYRAMVTARLAMAREAGVPGVAVWGAPTSAPILARLGFETVGWRKFFPDTSTA